MAPADKRYWGGVSDENMRLYHTILVNSRERPYHAHPQQSTRRRERSRTRRDRSPIYPVPRSKMPSEKAYWADVSKENKRLVNKIVSIEKGKGRKRSSSVIYPNPRRKYPSEVSYWNQVGNENERLMDRIFREESEHLKPSWHTTKPKARSKRSKRSSSVPSSFGGQIKFQPLKADVGDHTNLEVAVEFRDLDTDEIITKMLDVDLGGNSAGEDDNTASLEENFVSFQLAGAGLTTEEAKAAVKAIADQLYRPPWKGV